MINFKNKKYIIFDFNGTIIDDVQLCLDALNMLLRYNGKPECSYDKYKHIFTFPIKRYYELAGFDFNKHSYEHLANIFIDYYQKRSLDCSLYDGSIETFKYLIDLGRELSILSASKIDNLLEQVKHFGIDKYFKNILGTSDIYAYSKVQIGLNYINENNINRDEVLMIGDTLHDLEVGREMGIDVILTSSGHQAYDVLEKSNVLIIESIKDLMDHIKK